MNEDVMWFIDVIEMQWTSFRAGMDGKKLTREQFDRYSYSAWAISETLCAIAEMPGTVTTNDIVELLQAQMQLYMGFCEYGCKRMVRYEYCAETIQELIKLMGVMKQC